MFGLASAGYRELRVHDRPVYCTQPANSQLIPQSMMKCLGLACLAYLSGVSWLNYLTKTPAPQALLCRFYVIFCGRNYCWLKLPPQALLCKFYVLFCGRNYCWLKLPPPALLCKFYVLFLRQELLGPVQCGPEQHGGRVRAGHRLPGDHAHHLHGGRAGRAHAGHRLRNHTHQVYFSLPHTIRLEVLITGNKFFTLFLAFLAQR